MTCPTCNHDSRKPEPHKAGECKQCNCGSSEICHPTSSPFFYTVADYANNLHAWGAGMIRMPRRRVARASAR